MRPGETAPRERRRAEYSPALVPGNRRGIVPAVTADRRYLPIAEHGVIGDLHTVALVGTDGTIDWYCPERFDSPRIFASILDAEKGGHFRIAPVERDHTAKQLYFPDTNVLITRFLTPGGVGEVQDFMPIHRDPDHRPGSGTA